MSSTATSGRRALHYVFRIGNRAESIKYYTNYLGMKVLRHEEFDEACKATCNGPYDGKWSKTMIGYGPEDSNFVLELTYNYGISGYGHGNDLGHLNIIATPHVEGTICEDEKFKTGNAFSSVSPCGYPYLLQKGENLHNKSAATFDHVLIACSDFQHSIKFWKDLLGMQEFSLPAYFNDCKATTKRAALGYAKEQTKLVLQETVEPINRGKAFGRIAFSCPSNQLQEIERVIKENDETILTPYVSLDTPGKATVQVVILADPDGHEICFVGEEGFNELSKVDPKGSELLHNAMAEDKSDEWFQKHGKEKAN